ncbi:MAG: aminodeoxychorismate/anthranilate synthase component II [Planctomycetaceae bacterium]
MILLIDNYDSFVFNLARYLEELGQETLVVRNDACSVSEIAGWKPQAVVISPGPCTPREAGISVEVIRELSDSIPMLGVCLGHQAIAVAFGGTVIRAAEPIHGRTSIIRHDGAGVFAGIPNPFSATRYHSLIVEEAGLPAELKITAHTPEGVPMALAHTRRKVFGVQFHPESVLTEQGHRLLANFLQLAGAPVGPIPVGDRLPESDHAPAELPPLPHPVPWI